MAKLKLEIVTVERVVYTDDQVDMIVAPGIDGQLGILPRHAPLMTMLQPGELRVKKGGTEEALAVTGGFMEVMPDRVIILADSAEQAAEINVQRVEEAKRRAQEAIARRASDAELAEALSAYRRAEARLKVVQRRRRGPPTTGMGTGA